MASKSFNGENATARSTSECAEDEPWGWYCTRYLPSPAERIQVKRDDAVCGALIIRDLDWISVMDHLDWISVMDQVQKVSPKSKT